MKAGVRTPPRAVGWVSCGRDRRCSGGEAQRLQDRLNHRWLCDGGDHFCRSAALRAHENFGFKHTRNQLRPGQTPGAKGGTLSLRLGGGVGYNQGRRIRTIANHSLSPLCPRREDSVVAQRIAAGPGHENSEFFDQLGWLEHDMRRPVPPRVAKPVCDLPARKFEQPLSGDRRSRNIPAESLHSFSIPAPNRHSRVQAEAPNRSTLLPHSRLYVLDLDAIPKAHDSLAGAQSRRNAMLNRCLRTRRKQGFFFRERIRRRWPLFVEQTSTNQQPHDPLGDAGRQLTIRCSQSRW
jgi:hypothetical protein